MHPIHRVAVIVAATAVFLIATVAARADTKGFLIELAPLSNRVGTNPGAPVVVDREGGGAAIALGWGITSSFSLRLSIGGSEHKTSDPDVVVSYGTGTLDAAYLFRDERAVRPYLLGGIGGAGAEARQGALEFDVLGPAIVFGTGAYWFLGNTFAFDVGARWDFINWQQKMSTLTLSDGTKVVGETALREDGYAVRLRVGASFWF